MNHTWITSDWHFGHNAILHYAGRQFTDIREHDEYLIDTWNSSFEKKDDVLILGDMFLCGKERTLEILSKLNRTRVTFVAGNHDSNTALRLMAEHGWFVAPLVYRRSVAPGLKATLSHYPLISWAGRYDVEPGLHGHTHSPEPLWPGRNVLPPGVRMDVGLDAHGLKPWRGDELVEFLKPEVADVEQRLVADRYSREHDIG